MSAAVQSQRNESHFALLEQMSLAGGLSEDLLRPLVKTVGIALVSRVGAELCRDANQGALATVVETAGAFSAISRGHTAFHSGMGAAAGDAVMRKIFLLLVLLWCIVPACASQIPREITDAIPDSARPFLEDTDEADNFTSWNSGLSTLWTRTCKLLASTVQESLGGVILVMSAVPALLRGGGLLSSPGRR
ncbi:MAG: SpoIIIAC/SpoIIIAD family protein [Oscillospiraceae bacterium]